jgi:glycosyltransferase involved in cell wall biosynthesis
MQPPQIKALPPDVTRPSWSVMIPAYNCSELLPYTLQSVLVQDLGPKKMQIEVVDDGSTDADVKKLVAEIGGGRIQYFKQPHNVGSLKNFETCLNRSKGHLVHLLHGDDKVKVGYYEKMTQLFGQLPEIGAAFCRFDYINGKGETTWRQDPEQNEGILENWLNRIAGKQRVQYCAMTVKREVYERLGGFYGVTYGEDWEMWARIAAHYPVAYTPESLAEYRLHNNTISFNSLKTAKNIKDIRWVINEMQRFFPEDQRLAIKKAAYKNYARYAVVMANSIWSQTRSRKFTNLQIKEALKMHKDVTMIPHIAKVYLKMLIGKY